MSEKILIVNDNPIKLETLKEALEKGGYDTISLSNKEEIVKSCIEFNPHLILLDIEMPIKEGYKLCGDLRESPDTKDIKVIIIKNKDNPQDKSWSIVKGSDFYFAARNVFSEKTLIQSISSID